MGKIVVLGAGVCGLTASMMLARDGHQVIVLERDDAPTPMTPDAAWQRWSRDGVTQFRQPHLLLPAGHAILSQELPDVVAALAAAGAAPFDLLCTLPPTIDDRAPRPDDQRFVTLAARRPVLEQVVAQAAQAEPGMDIRRGVRVRGLTARSYDGTPHVTGVRLDSGEQVDADLVVDAMGRRSPSPDWLAQIGAPGLHEEADDSGFIYYNRFFRSRAGGLPMPRTPLSTPLGTFSLLTLPSDNDTWSVTVFISTGDQPLKRLRDPDRWTSLVEACPLHAHWLDGDPITDVTAMSGVLDRYRRLVVGGQPVATGIALLADAWACTNPSLGRGITLGLRHARQLRDLLRNHQDDPRTFAVAWDGVTESELTPWYRDTVREDRSRAQDMQARRTGTQPPRPDPAVAALLAAMTQDADLFRAFLENRSGLSTFAELLARPGLLDRAFTLAADLPPFPAPDRDQLLQLVA